MTQGRWRQISAIYNEAALRNGAARGAYLSEVCGGDAALRRDVEMLLEQGDSFLTKPLSLESGRRVGAYEVLEVIGAGGMGVVYRARDLKLQRDVALKVLPDAVAHDPERIARFRREATVLASLNHPNIAAIYGFEDSGDVQALVLELVEGPTLADRIAHGPIPIEEALPIARQICDALEAAHEQGIIHRDLKPANIKLRPDGTVKVLDFGLAKLTEAAAADRAGGAGDVAAGFSRPDTLSPTITSPAMMTGVGVLLGTATYMSPEQARGKPADKRSDIWAFGCVLYEMLTNRRAFEGDDVGDTLANVLKSPPDWHALPATTPTAVHRLLRRCLQKDRRRRLADAADATLELDEPETTPAATRTFARERVGWLSGVVLLLVVATALAVWPRRLAPAAPEMRLEITTPDTPDPASFALSPDGMKIVYVAPYRDQPHLWLRELASTSAAPLVGTQNAHLPFWSPDGLSIAFFAGQRLAVLDVAGRAVRTLATGQFEGLGGSWSRDGTVLFAPAGVAPLLRVAATGGTPIAATRLRPQERSHTHPEFLPDGQHFLYYVAGAPDVRGVYVGTLGELDGKRVLDADANAVYTSGHLLFLRQDTVFAQRFDPDRGEATGIPQAVSQQVATPDGGAYRWGSPLTSSRTGVVAFRTNGSATSRQLTWLDRSGREVAKVGDADLVTAGTVAISPDSTRLAFPRVADGNTDVWMFEIARGILTRITFDPALDSHALWSPDGTRLIFQRFHDGVGDLFLHPATADGREELLLANMRGNVATDWSNDGLVLVKSTGIAENAWDIGVLPMDSDRKLRPVVKTAFVEGDAQFSPDRQWIAYQSNESGQFDIYVQKFPAGRRERISPTGGAQVRWRPDGKELFYLALDGRLMSVSVRLDSQTSTIQVALPVPLFATRIGPVVLPVARQQYSVSPDGQRFLMNVITGEDKTMPITVVLNAKDLQN